MITDASIFLALEDILRTEFVYTVWVRIWCGIARPTLARFAVGNAAGRGGRAVVIALRKENGAATLGRNFGQTGQSAVANSREREIVVVVVIVRRAIRIAGRVEVAAKFATRIAATVTKFRFRVRLMVRSWRWDDGLLYFVLARTVRETVRLHLDELRSLDDRVEAALLVGRVVDRSHRTVRLHQTVLTLHVVAFTLFPEECREDFLKNMRRGR